AAFVPLNFRLAGPEIAYIMNDCSAVALIADQNLRPVAESVRGELQSVRAWRAVAGETAGGAALDGGDAAAAQQVRVGADDT
ncbi:acyl-CoA synthetase, partial [Citrobacter sp. AAK_AS5]